MNEQNFVEDTQDSTEDIQYQAYVALVEDFKEFIDTTVKAGKDSYKHVDLFNGKSLDEFPARGIIGPKKSCRFWLSDTRRRGQARNWCSCFSAVPISSV